GVAQQRMRIGHRQRHRTRNRRRQIGTGHQQPAGEDPGREEEEGKAGPERRHAPRQAPAEQTRCDREQELEAAGDGEEDDDLAGAHERARSGPGPLSPSTTWRARAWGPPSSAAKRSNRRRRSTTTPRTPST